MTDSLFGTSIRIFLVDGTPDGLRFVERSNWTGQAMVVSRSEYTDVRSRSEFGSPGVYVLLGSDDDSSDPMLYIGEGDDVRARLDQHVKNKDFWTKVVVFRSKDGTLNKAHVRYLESRLVELAKATGAWSLDNSAAPQKPALTEPDIADLESFLSDMLVIYPILGVDAFEVPKRESSKNAPGGSSKESLLFLSTEHTSAEGYDRPEGFMVLAGSRARIKETKTTPDQALKLRRQLLEKGGLVEDGASYVLTQDIVFNSPSLAAAFLAGRNMNGRIEWKDSKGKTLKSIQESKLVDEVQAAPESPNQLA